MSVDYKDAEEFEKWRIESFIKMMRDKGVPEEEIPPQKSLSGLLWRVMSILDDLDY